jgi:hypothetical protein
MLIKLRKALRKKNRLSAEIIGKFNIEFLLDEFTKFFYQQKLRIRETKILNTDDAEKAQANYHLI